MLNSAIASAGQPNHGQISRRPRPRCGQVASRRTRESSRDQRPTPAGARLTGRLGFHSRRPSKPPSRNVVDDRGEPPGSTPLAARRARYPRPEQMARKMLRNVEIRGVHAAGNGPSSDRKWWQRLELGIHGLNRWTVKCLEMSRNRGVHAARNGPSEDRKSWQHIELGIHGLRSWGRNWSRKVRETRSSGSDQCPQNSLCWFSLQRNLNRHR